MPGLQLPMTPKICSGLPEIINQYVQLAHWVPVVWATKYKFPEAQLQNQNPGKG